MASVRWQENVDFQKYPLPQGTPLLIVVCENQIRSLSKTMWMESMIYAAPAPIAAATRDVERQARSARRLSASPFLALPLQALGYNSRELWAWEAYESAVLGFVAHCRDAGRHEGGLVRLLEI